MSFKTRTFCPKIDKKSSKKNSRLDNQDRAIRPSPLGFSTWYSKWASFDSSSTASLTQPHFPIESEVHDCRFILAVCAMKEAQRASSSGKCGIGPYQSKDARAQPYHWYIRHAALLFTTLLKCNVSHTKNVLLLVVLDGMRERGWSCVDRSNLTFTRWIK